MNNRAAKPFLKWAGGKTQLISEIQQKLPGFIKGESFTYIEPFVGSGAVMFWMIENFDNIDSIVINDINKDLTDSYLTIKENVEELITILSVWQNEYYNLVNNAKEKKEYYYNKRKVFNERNSNRTIQSALFIFLNKTCFNGLYRVNRKNEFNVPIGSYKKPLICNSDNLRLVMNALKNVTILNGDYTETLKYSTKNTIFYLDPPYKPLSETSSFNSYAKDTFDDSEQVRLRDFCTLLDKLDHQWILSNSDLKSKNPDDDFFDELYADFNINRVLAKRSINANPAKRGNLTELLITN